MPASYPIGLRWGRECAATRLYLCLVQRPAALLPPVAAPLKALVALAARLEQPRDKGVVMACWMIARLALPRLPRESDVSDPDALLLRAEATRRWLAMQALPSAVSLAASRGCDLGSERDPSLLADALDALRDAADAVLDNSARAELTTLAHLLRRSSLAAMH